MVALIFKSVISDWITRRIDAGVEERLKTRLAAHQLELDKELERFRVLLSRDTEHTRALLHKEGVDYGIYAQRRHDAITRLFDAFLRIEVSVTDFSDLSAPPAASIHLSQLTPLMSSLGLLQVERSRLLGMVQSEAFENADKMIDEAREQAMKRRVIQGRNDAAEAYYQGALYLPDFIDQAAIAVRDHFHMLIIPYVVKSPDSGIRIYPNKTELRSLMLEFQNKARAELSGSARLVKATALASS